MPNTGLAQLIAMRFPGLPTHELRPDLMGANRINSHYKNRFDMYLAFACAMGDNDDRNPVLGESAIDFFTSQLFGYERFSIEKLTGYKEINGRKKPIYKTVALDFYTSEENKKQIRNLLPAFRKLTSPRTGRVFYIIEGIEQLEYKLTSNDLDDYIPLAAGGSVPGFKIKEVLERLETLATKYINAVEMEASPEQEAQIRQFAEITSATTEPMDAKLTPEERDASNLEAMRIIRKMRERPRI